VLEPHVERVIVYNIRGRGETDNKNDCINADRLSERLRLGSLKPVYHGGSTLLMLKELVKSYGNLVEDGTHGCCGSRRCFARGIKDARHRGVSEIDAQSVVVAARAVRCANESRGAVRPARRAAGATTEAKTAMIAEARRQVLRSIPYLGPRAVAASDTSSPD
jgi:hypothetical protein